MRTLATVLAGLVLALLPVSAHADTADCTTEGDYTEATALCWPLPNPNVVIQGSTKAWQIRAFAERVDEVLAGLDVRSGDCSTFPAEWTCVTIVEGNDPNDVMGRASWDAEWDITIMLNKANQDLPRDQRRTVAAHEFAHALGLRHGDLHSGGPGLMTVPRADSLTPMPSPVEWFLLEQAYGPFTTIPA